MDKEILATLLYFDMFNHPLTADEIYHFNKSPVEEATILKALNGLQEAGLIKKIAGFYALKDDSTIVETRLDANLRAEKKMETAWRFCRIISKFPFVRSVMLSGSISKGVMYPDSDIDYFIITEKSRLWITKLLLTLFKKIILLNSYRNFCINYFISENALEIEEKNRFTATEIVTLIPLYGYDLYLNFLEQNIWVRNYFANFPVRERILIVDKKPGILRKTLEFVFDNQMGNYIDTWFMNLTRNRYLKKYKNSYGEEAVQIAFKSNPNTSKVHPSHYQRKFLEKYQEKVKTFEQKNALKII